MLMNLRIVAYDVTGGLTALQNDMIVREAVEGNLEINNQGEFNVVSSQGRGGIGNVGRYGQEQ